MMLKQEFLTDIELGEDGYFVLDQEGDTIRLSPAQAILVASYFKENEDESFKCWSNS